MGRIFGTDGVRGIANTELSCKLAMNVGRAAAMVVAEHIGRRPIFIIGKDTRISSGMLEAALAAGLTSVGADVVLAGIMPTPALSCLIVKSHADAGIMISASHNSYEFNGIKIFGPEGFKLSDADEFEIERIVLDKTKPYSLRWGWELGRINHGKYLLETYMEHIIGTVNGDLEGLRVAVDCANGSACVTAAGLFSRLKAQAHILNNHPNGVNINRACGSTYIEKLAEFVRNSEGEFDAGVAFDGDADRCIAVDETGAAIDGDVIMAILAGDMRANGNLNKNTLVATVMSNMGLLKFAGEHDIIVESTKVGDRYVLEQMLRRDCNLGGEQSGHIILLDHMQTGDGQLTALTLMSILKKSGKKLSELARVMTVYPQAMVCIQADAVMKSMLDIDKGVEKIIGDAQAVLGHEGRILVRASGTEPLIRIMAEGRDQNEISKLVGAVAEQLKEMLSHNEDCKKLEGF